MNLLYYNINKEYKLSENFPESKEMHGNSLNPKMLKLC